MSSQYKELYAVPKEVYESILQSKRKHSTLPNVRNINVDQLNFNEAREINPSYLSCGFGEKKEKDGSSYSKTANHESVVTKDLVRNRDYDTPQSHTLQRRESGAPYPGMYSTPHDENSFVSPASVQQAENVELGNRIPEAEQITNAAPRLLPQQDENVNLNSNNINNNPSSNVPDYSQYNSTTQPIPLQATVNFPKQTTSTPAKNKKITQPSILPYPRLSVIPQRKLSSSSGSEIDSPNKTILSSPPVSQKSFVERAIDQLNSSVQKVYKNTKTGMTKTAAAAEPKVPPVVTTAATAGTSMKGNVRASKKETVTRESSTGTFPKQKKLTDRHPSPYRSSSQRSMPFAATAKPTR